MDTPPRFRAVWLPSWAYDELTELRARLIAMGDRLPAWLFPTADEAARKGPAWSRGVVLGLGVRALRRVLDGIGGMQ